MRRSYPFYLGLLFLALLFPSFALGTEVSLQVHRQTSAPRFVGATASKTILPRPSEETVRYGIYIGGVELTSENCTPNIPISLPSIIKEGDVTYDPDTKTLTLRSATIEVAGMSAIQVTEDDQKICLAEGLTRLISDDGTIPSLVLSAKNTTIITQNVAEKPELRLSCSEPSYGGVSLLLEGDASLRIENALVETERGVEGKGVDKGASLTVVGYGLSIRSGGLTRLSQLNMSHLARIFKPENAYFIDGEIRNADGAVWDPIEISLPHYEVYFFGREITEVNQDDLLAGTPFATPGAKAHFLPSDNGKPPVLTLENVSLVSTSEDVAIENRAAEGLEIRYAGTVTLSASLYGLWVKSSTRLIGKGEYALLTTNTSGCQEAGIALERGSLEIRGHVKAYGARYGIHAMNVPEARFSILQGGLLEAHCRTVNPSGESAAAVLPQRNDVTVLSPQGATFRDGNGVAVDAEGKNLQGKTLVLKMTPKTYDLTIAGVPVTTDNQSDLTKIDGVSVTEGGSITFEEDPIRGYRLFLNNATIAATGSAHALATDHKLSIYLEGKNTLTAENDAVKAVSAPLECEGADMTKWATLAISSTHQNAVVGTEVSFGHHLDVRLTSVEAVALLGSGTTSKLEVNSELRAQGKESAFAGIAHFSGASDSRIFVPHFDAKWDNGRVVDALGRPAPEVQIGTSIERGFSVCGREIHDRVAPFLAELEGVTLGEGGHFYLELPDVSNQYSATLHLKNVTLSHATPLVVSELRQAGVMTIVLEGDNHITTDGAVAISSCSSLREFDLAVKGTGSLTVRSTTGQAIYTKDLSVTLAKLIVNGATEGIRAKKLLVEGGSVTATGTAAGAILSNVEFRAAKFENATHKFDESKGGVVGSDGELVKENVKIVPTSDVTFYPLWLKGIPVTSEKLTQLNDKPITYDPVHKRLTFTDVTWQESGFERVLVRSEIPDLEIRFEGKNTLDGHFIFSENTTLRMAKGATLTLTEPQFSVITTRGDLTFVGGLFELEYKEGVCIYNPSNDKRITFDKVELRITNLDEEKRAMAIGCKEIVMTRCQVSKPVEATIGAGVFNNGNEISFANTVLDAQKKPARDIKISLKAQEYDLSIAGTPLTSDNFAHLAQIKGVTLGEGGAISYDPASKILSLRNVSLFSTDEPLLESHVEGLQVVVEGWVNISRPSGEALVLAHTTHFSGSGHLSLTNGLTVHAAALSLKGLTVEALGIWKGTGAATLTLDHATLSIKSFAAPLVGFTNLELTGTAIVYPDATAWDSSAHLLMRKNAPVTEVSICMGSFSLTPRAHFFTTAGGEGSVTIQTQAAWHVRKVADWVTLATTQGNGEQQMTFTVAENTEADSRTTSLIVKLDGREWQQVITILQAGKKDVALTALAFEQTQLPMNPNQTLKLKPTYTPANATNKELIWSVTSGSEFVEVDARGQVTAKQQEGEAVVTATSLEGGLTASCTIAVRNGAIAVEALKVLPESLAMVLGDKDIQLVADVTPLSAATPVTWQVTAGEGCVAVSPTGVVSVLAVGEAEVTATAGDKSATCKIVVTATLERTLTLDPPVLTFAVGAAPVHIKAVISPAEEQSRNLIWSLSSGEGVVLLSKTGWVKALKPGNAVVMVTTEDGSLTATCPITVEGEIEKPTPVEDPIVAGLSVVPNPFAAHLRILNTGAFVGRYQLVNATGVVVRAGVLESTELEIDTTALPTGIYIMRFEASNGAKRTQRVVKY